MIKRTTRNKEGEIYYIEILNSRYEIISVSFDIYTEVLCERTETGIVIKCKNPARIGYQYDDNNEREIKIKYPPTETIFILNKDEKLIKTTVSDVEKESYEYDDNGNLIKYKNSFGYEESYEYDEQNRLIKTKYSDYVEESYEYDDKGNRIKYKDSDGIEKLYEYNDKGNLIKTKDSNGFEISFEYDENERLIKFIGSNGDEESYEYEEIKIKE